MKSFDTIEIWNYLEKQGHALKVKQWIIEYGWGPKKRITHQAARDWFRDLFGEPQGGIEFREMECHCTQRIDNPLRVQDIGIIVDKLEEDKDIGSVLISPNIGMGDIDPDDPLLIMSLILFWRGHQMEGIIINLIPRVQGIRINGPRPKIAGLNKFEELSVVEELSVDSLVGAIKQWLNNYY